MATVANLAKLMNLTDVQMIERLAKAGIIGKNANSEVSTEERKSLLQKRKLVTNINLKKSKTISTSSGIKIQIKAKRPQITQNNKEILAVKEALEISRKKTEKERKQDIIRQNLTKTKNQIELEAQQITNKLEQQKIKTQAEEDIRAEKIRKQQELKQQAEKEKEKNNKTKENRPKNYYNHPQHNGFKNKNKQKLKKRDKTKLSQKLREEQEQHAFQKPAEKIILEISVPEVIKVLDLAMMMKTKAATVVKTMMAMGVMATLNDTIDQDTAMLVVEEMGHIASVDKGKTVEDTLMRKKDNIGMPRPPIVTIMGHVDHGKTSLLDYIRKTKIANSEIGGITQHIGAYKIKTNNSSITFIDTPGHAAFGKMRERGANITDIVILVVAADDGVMLQTIQSIKYAKKVKVPIIIAINKIDKEGANIDKVKQMLSSYDVVAEDWGGDVIISPISAHTGEGIDELLNNITLTAELLELKAEIDTPAHGVVLEAKIDKGRGKVVNILVQSGTLKKGDIVIAGLEYGKIKQIIADNGDILAIAGPSTPIEILGLSGVPEAGDEILVVKNERKAREVADFRKTQARDKVLQKQQAEKMENFLKKMEEGDVSIVNIMIKADVHGSSQAIVDSLEELSTDEVRVKIVLSEVGAINNTDVVLAETSNAMILGFNVRADSVARKEAATIGVKIKYYSIIYNLIDDVKAMMSGLLKPELSENIIGIADVKDVFSSQKLGDIAGCIVTEGIVRRDSLIRVLRENIVVFEGELESLRRFKDDVKEVKSGTECGIGVAGYNVKKGDQIEVFEQIEIAKTL